MFTGHYSDEMVRRVEVFLGITEPKPNQRRWLGGFTYSSLRGDVTHRDARVVYSYAMPIFVQVGPDPTSQRFMVETSCEPRTRTSPTTERHSDGLSYHVSAGQTVYPDRLWAPIRRAVGLHVGGSSYFNLTLPHYAEMCERAYDGALQKWAARPKASFYRSMTTIEQVRASVRRNIRALEVDVVLENMESEDHRALGRLQKLVARTVQPEPTPAVVRHVERLMREFERGERVHAALMALLGIDVHRLSDEEVRLLNLREEMLGRPPAIWLSAPKAPAHRKDL